MKTGGWFCCGRRKLVVVFVLYQHNDTGEICTAEKSLVSGCLMLACVCLCRCPLACRFARWPARPLACMYVTVCYSMLQYVCMKRIGTPFAFAMVCVSPESWTRRIGKHYGVRITRKLDEDD